MSVQEKIYPESGVELSPFIAKNYDFLMNSLTLGRYGQFIRKAISDIGIKPDDWVVDLGCGTGRNAALMLPFLGPNGKITGIDLSPIMGGQFTNRFSGEKRVNFQQQRIDIPFKLGARVDVIFISFVIHGFPHEVRKAILSNVREHLKPGGIFAILDFSEFSMEKMPPLHRWVFKTFECPYAFDFVERDWKDILAVNGFTPLLESFYFKNYVRLLKAGIAQ